MNFTVLHGARGAAQHLAQAGEHVRTDCGVEDVQDGDSLNVGE